MRFTKMHGAGNDYIYIDCFRQSVPEDPATLAVALSDRHTGVGADGLILICPSEVADAQMRMWNADGSTAEMCGNGIRCVAKFLYEHNIARQDVLQIETGRGILALQLCLSDDDQVEQVRVNMGRPIVKSADIPTTLPGNPPVRMALRITDRTLEVTSVSMGNPHCVLFVDEPTDEWVTDIGPVLERHSAFPNRTNVEFVKVLSPTEINMRVWERGSGETQACGTGACAAVVAGVLAGLLKQRVLVHLPGGNLEIELDESGEVFLTGPAVEVFHGEWHQWDRYQSRASNHKNNAA